MSFQAIAKLNCMKDCPAHPENMLTYMEETLKKEAVWDGETWGIKILGHGDEDYEFEVGEFEEAGYTKKEHYDNNEMLKVWVMYFFKCVVSAKF